MLVAALLAAAPVLTAAEEIPAPTKLAAPFDMKAPTPHRISMAVDTTIARDILTVLSGREEAPAALRRLRSSSPLSVAFESERVKADQFFGKLASAAAGSPDPLFEKVALNAKTYGDWLNKFDEDGVLLARATGLRIASLLPAKPEITSEVLVIPVFGLARFAEVDAVSEGDRIYFLVDLERVALDARTGMLPREALLKVLRSTASSAWKTYFDRGARSSTVWSSPTASPFDTFLASTISEGPATLFLFPDEFFPLSTFLEEPINRSFEKWNSTAEVLLDGKKDEKARKAVLENQKPDDFWGRHTGIVGAQITEGLLRHDGRTAFLEALALGPRAVATLYSATAKKAKLPVFAKPVRKYLEEPPRPASANR